MKLVSTTGELLANVERLAWYIGQPGSFDAEFAKGLINRGICFVVVSKGGTAFFAPSRFVGYVGNSRTAHLKNHGKDGRDTNAALIQVLLHEPRPNSQLDAAYLVFCKQLGIFAKQVGNFGIVRKFWDLRKFGSG